MGFYGLIELSGITLHGIPLAQDSCEIILHVGSLDSILEGDAVPWLMDMGMALPLVAASAVLDVALENEVLLLQCPY